LKTFVNKNSIVRQIWGDADTILLIFCGSAAEFSLNKAVDWLYFTGKLPADPLGRLFSTVKYAQQIIFLDEESALKSIDKITAIHHSIETSRGMKIPDWAYRDVLFMLIYYSIVAFELMKRKLTEQEKEEIFQVFRALGQRMNLKELPNNFSDWLPIREQHMHENLENNQFTTNLYQQYRKHLGQIRFFFLIEAQKVLLPKYARILLEINTLSIIKPLLNIYNFLGKYQLSQPLRKAILPKAYFQQIIALDK
jgi:ER-bound oxygenase mpaB/B'/Rubber oxygenase, catalytic domain